MQNKIWKLRNVLNSWSSLRYIKVRGAPREASQCQSEKSRNKKIPSCKNKMQSLIVGAFSLTRTSNLRLANNTLPVFVIPFNFEKEKNSSHFFPVFPTLAIVRLLSSTAISNSGMFCDQENICLASSSSSSPSPFHSRYLKSHGFAHYLLSVFPLQFSEICWEKKPKIF